MSRALAFTFFAVLAAAQDFSDIRFEVLAKGLTYSEGPAWSLKENYLVFSDTPSDRLMKWVPGQRVEVLREKANGPSGNAFDSEGRLYTCELRTRRITRTNKDGSVDVLADRWEGKRLNAPNDVVVSRNGHVYFTDPAFGDQAEHRELDFYGVYHLPPKGPLKLVAKPSGRPNGIALSPNGRILYVANSDERNVRAYDVDKNGETSNERVFVSGLAGIPGGLRVDEKGDVYVAARGIQIFSPQGKPLHTIEIHGKPANCAFGEVDLKTLFITAGPDVYRARLEIKGAY